MNPLVKYVLNTVFSSIVERRIIDLSDKRAAKRASDKA
jgi:hypothetical protein